MGVVYASISSFMTSPGLFFAFLHFNLTKNNDHVAVPQTKTNNLINLHENVCACFLSFFFQKYLT